ncbi:MAG: dethiobiotin synthase [Gammaproteobacteria bacterium]|nr:dethiobiotin synthase [Gammaproteobacteria bacterium]
MGARGYFIAGTDTGIGKTRITCALLQAFNAIGHRAVGMKPVATGAKTVDGHLVSEDAAMIAANSAISGAEIRIAPYAFRLPVSPDIAADSAGICIDLDVISRQFADLASNAEFVLVEGTGGWLCPIGARTTMADLAVRLGLPVILVVGLKLGCINHALLAAESIRAHGCTLTGWIGNRIDLDYLLPQANLATLSRLLGMPPLAVVEFAPRAPCRPGPDVLELVQRLGLQG